MSRHSWVFHNIESYIAGGLSEGERERVEQHAAECEECDRAMKEAEAFDTELDALFAGVRPKAALEDRLIQSLRTAPRRPGLSRFIKVALAAAAMFVLIVSGAGLSALIGQDRLLMPGEMRNRLQTSNNLHQVGIGLFDRSESMVRVDRSYYDGVPETKHDSKADPARPALSQSDGKADKIKSADAMAKERRERSSFWLNPIAHNQYFVNGKQQEGRTRYGTNVPPITAADGTSNTLPFGDRFAEALRYEGKDLAKHGDNGQYGKLPPAVGFSPDGKRLAIAQKDAGLEKDITNRMERWTGQSVGGKKQESNSPTGASINRNYYGDDIDPNGALSQSNSLASTAKAELNAAKALVELRKAEAASTQLAYEYSKQQFERYKELMELKSIDARLVDEEHDKLKSAKAANDAAKAAVNTAVAEAAAKAAIVEHVAKGGQLPSKTSDPTKGYFKPSDAVASLDTTKNIVVTSDGEPKKRVQDADGYAGKVTKNQTEVKTPEKVEQRRQKQPAKAQKQPPAAQRKIIRSGEMDFQVESFEEAVARITDLVEQIKGGYVATVNSDKLTNGKVRGSVVVRVPPGNLDKLVTDIRRALTAQGELLGMHIGSEDISKKYFDLESRLKAARTMEDRLLKIIKDGKGEIKDLLQAEKELGVWRTKIEELEGTLRYFNNLVSLSTLTITMSEKSIRSAASATQNERVQAGIEVTDVNKALDDAKKAVFEAKGRVTLSKMKKHSAGQFQATLHFEVKPDKAGPLLDHLRQLGNMVRLERDLVQQTENSKPAPPNVKVEQGDTLFMVSIYNLANIAPRESVTLRLAAPDVADAYRKLRDTVDKVKGRIKDAQLNENDQQNVTARLDFAMMRTGESDVLKTLNEAGVVLARQVVRVPAGEDVTDARVGYKVELVPTVAIPPRERITLAFEVSDVDAVLTLFKTRVKEAGGRAVDPKISQEANGRITARVIYEVPLSEAVAITEKFKNSGRLRVYRVIEDEKAPTGKLARAFIDVTLSNAPLLVPEDESLWTQIRAGLSISFRGLAFSVSWIIVAVLFILPWAILIYAVVWIIRRLWGSGSRTPTPAAATPAGSGGAGSRK